MDNLEVSRVIDYNERYHYIPSNTKIVQSTCAESVSYNTSSASGLSETVLTFTMDVEGNHLDRNVVLKMPVIPLAFTRSTALDTGAKTVAGFFDNFDTICYRQYGLLNAISSVRVSLDGKLAIESSDLARNMNILGQFYNKEQVHHFFQSSQPDLFATYAMISSSDPTIECVNGAGTKFFLRKPIFADGSIFTQMSDAYSSRLLVCDSDTTFTTATVNANVTLRDLKTVLPFNVFGTAMDELPLYGVKKIVVTINLYNEWWKRIFSIKSTASCTISDIRFRRDQLSEAQPHLSYIVRTGPRDSTEKAQLTHSVELATVQTSANLVEYDVDAHTRKDVSTSIKFDLQCIPKRSYIWVKALYSEANKSNTLREAMTCDLYARIDSLKIKVDNKETTLASSEPSTLYDIAKGLGLNKSFEQFMYLNSSPIPIDYSETIGLSSGVLVGSPGGRNGGTTTLNVTLSFTNLCSEKMHYQVGCTHVYQSMLTAHNNTWSILSSFDSVYDEDSAVQDLEQQLMGRYNYIGGRSGGGIGAIFSSFLPKIGNGLKNLVTAAFTSPEFRKAVSTAWSGPKAPLEAARNAGAGFDNHSPIGGFYQHSNNYNAVGGKPVSQWSSM